MADILKDEIGLEPKKSRNQFRKYRRKVEPILADLDGSSLNEELEKVVNTLKGCYDSIMFGDSDALSNCTKLGLADLMVLAGSCFSNEITNYKNRVLGAADRKDNNEFICYLNNFNRVEKV